MPEEEIDSQEFAFLYFAISLLIVTLLPLTFSVIKKPFGVLFIKKDAKYKRVHSIDEKKAERE
jgi:hypothetical protein